jgi:hypothetical protein
MANEELFVANLHPSGEPTEIRLYGGNVISRRVGPQSFAEVSASEGGSLPWAVGSPTALDKINSLPAILAFSGSFTAVLYPTTAVLYPRT